MEVDRQAQILSDAEDPSPLWLRNIEVTRFLVVRGKEQSAVSCLMTSDNLLLSRFQIPEWDTHDRNKALRIGRRPFREIVVVRLKTRESHFLTKTEEGVG